MQELGDGKTFLATFMATMVATVGLPWGVPIIPIILIHFIDSGMICCHLLPNR